jgi:hypothetical protein
MSCVQSSGTPSACAWIDGAISRQAARQREIGIRKERIFIVWPLVFTSAARAGDDCFGGSITSRSISIAYETSLLFEAMLAVLGAIVVVSAQAQSASPVATTSPRPTTASPSPRATATARPNATSSPTMHGVATASPSTRGTPSPSARLEVTASPSGGAELERESLPASWESPPEAASRAGKNNGDSGAASQETRKARS